MSDQVETLTDNAISGHLKKQHDAGLPIVTDWLEKEHPDVLQLRQPEQLLQMVVIHNEEKATQLRKELVALTSAQYLKNILVTCQSKKNMCDGVVNAHRAQYSIEKGRILNYIEYFFMTVLQGIIDFDRWFTANFPKKVMGISTRNGYMMVARRVDSHILIPFGYAFMREFCAATEQISDDDNPENIRRINELLRSHGIDHNNIENRDWESDEELKEFKCKIMLIAEGERSRKDVLGIKSIRDRVEASPGLFNEDKYSKAASKAFAKHLDKSGSDRVKKDIRSAVKKKVRQSILDGDKVNASVTTAIVDETYAEFAEEPTHQFTKIERHFNMLDKSLIRSNDYLLDLGETLSAPEKNQMQINKGLVRERVAKIRESAINVLTHTKDVEAD